MTLTACWLCAIPAQSIRQAVPCLVSIQGVTRLTAIHCLAEVSSPISVPHPPIYRGRSQLTIYRKQKYVRPMQFL